MKFAVLASALVLFAAACSPIGAAVGTGAALGVASQQEGGLSGAADDLRISARINDLWFRYNVDTFRKLNLSVDQGRVLVTGVVQDPDARVEAIRLVWQVKGVKQVMNEIRVADSEGITGYLRDQWIATRLRTALTFDGEVYSINYSIETVQGTVYLMGYARTQAELDHVIGVARTIPGVRQVISYVKLPGEEVAAPYEGPGVPQSANNPQMYQPVDLAPAPVAAPAPEVEAQPLPDLGAGATARGHMRPDGTWIPE